MSRGLVALREKLIRVDAQTARWLFAAFVIFVLFFELAARHAALALELPRLRVMAGEAAGLGATIRTLRTAEPSTLAPAALAAALDALAGRQELALKSTADGNTVTTRGRVAPEALIRWLETSQRELRRPVASARLESAGTAGAPLVEVTVVWTAGEGV